MFESLGKCPHRRVLPRPLGLLQGDVLLLVLAHALQLDRPAKRGFSKLFECELAKDVWEIDWILKLFLPGDGHEMLGVLLASVALGDVDAEVAHQALKVQVGQVFAGDLEDGQGDLEKMMIDMV